MICDLSKLAIVECCMFHRTPDSHAMHYHPRYALQENPISSIQLSSSFGSQDQTSKEILQVGRQWLGEKVPLAACRPVCGL